MPVEKGMGEHASQGAEGGEGSGEVLAPAGNPGGGGPAADLGTVAGVGQDGEEAAAGRAPRGLWRGLPTRPGSASKRPAGWHLGIFQIQLNLSCFCSWAAGLTKGFRKTRPGRSLCEAHGPPSLPRSRAALPWPAAELPFSRYSLRICVWVGPRGQTGPAKGPL